MGREKAGQKTSKSALMRKRELTMQLNFVHASGGAQAANVNFHLTLGLHPDPRKNKILVLRHIAKEGDG